MHNALRAYRALRWHFEHALDRLPDRALGIDTSTRMDYEQLSIDIAVTPDFLNYWPARWTCLYEGLCAYRVTEREVFVDFGCGKGRVIYLASRYRFKEVIGVDVSESALEVARKNLEKTRSRRRCGKVTLCHVDATQYPIPPEMSVAFFYNPFRGNVFESVIGNIRDSLAGHPRNLRIICLRPLYQDSVAQHDCLLRAGFHVVRCSQPFRPFTARELVVYSTVEP